MAEAIEADALERNGAALDAACRREIAAAAREGVPLGSHVAITRTVQVTMDVRAGQGDDLRMVRVRACKAVG
jgi:hypothetical protein